ncbi:RNA polymerase sigma-70 factor [Pararcticibacter amylolyticus]|uniref:RNA polymerase sigma-70 factor n=1 Tax=Pararcticibacter amylolyticus TaxID=2173175 RepID=A0A2U2PD36_9SPHI|nr:RNA polymerase sigma-70 factor [Pararcticibacter amylolyticus]PWG79224.1 RNA polymerase sigma-70 factor [Pararcticibacter amylolyticus]
MNIFALMSEKGNFVRDVKTTVLQINEVSFEEAYTALSGKIYRMCYFYLKDSEDAKEVVHDIFRSIWERRETLEIRTSLEAYLIKAAKLKILQNIRNRISQEQHLEYVMKDFCDSRNVTEQDVMHSLLNRNVKQLIDQLSCQCKRVFKLSREKGMSNKEIASTLMISEKAVEYHMSNALSFLRKNLSEYNIK